MQKESREVVTQLDGQTTLLRRKGETRYSSVMKSNRKDRATTLGIILVILTMIAFVMARLFVGGLEWPATFSNRIAGASFLVYFPCTNWGVYAVAGSNCLSITLKIEQLLVHRAPARGVHLADLRAGRVAAGDEVSVS